MPGGGVIAGHGRIMGARKLGLEQVPCIRLGYLTEAQKRAYIIADNKIALNAGWDDEMLKLEMAELRQGGFDLDLLGFDDDEMMALLGIAPSPTGTDPEKCPPVEKEAISVEGDIWLLGQHRLVCGDCTNVETMGRLMPGEMADVCWTDPPYNVAYGDKAEMLNDYEKGHRNTKRILNDDMDDASFKKFLGDFYRTAYTVMKPGAAIYVAHSETERSNFTREMLRNGFKLSGVVIWRKNALVLGRSDYQWIHEPILYGWKTGGPHKWYGGRKKTTIENIGDDTPFVKRADGKWEVHMGVGVFVVDGQAEVEELLTSIIVEAKPTRNDIHPTMKPVALIERQIKNSAKRGDIVLDAFGGSGSTLMAAERLGMRARLSELSPNYVDVIVRRWQEYTGQRAVHAVTGKPFPE